MACVLIDSRSPLEVVVFDDFFDHGTVVAPNKSSGDKLPGIPSFYEKWNAFLSTTPCNEILARIKSLLQSSQKELRIRPWDVDRVCTWDVDRVCTWLVDDVGLAKYVDTFREEAVHGDVLLDVFETPELAVELVEPVHVQQLLDGIAALLKKVPPAIFSEKYSFHLVLDEPYVLHYSCYATKEDEKKDEQASFTFCVNIFPVPHNLQYLQFDGLLIEVQRRSGDTLVFNKFYTWLISALGTVVSVHCNFLV